MSGCADSAFGSRDVLGKTPDAEPTDADPEPRRRVFVSYAREDGKTFADRLAADLQQQGGYSVWMDRDPNAIGPGRLWEVRVEQGLRAADVVTVVMTPGAQRERSVCRDEVAFACNEDKPLVPLLAAREAKPTLLLARRNWIDFTASYEQGLDALLRCLKGDDSGLREPALPSVTGLAPLDFGPEIARYSSGFVGREWLLRDIDRWLDESNQRAMIVVGEPGIGKSALAAWLGLERAREVAGIHFCTHRNTRSLNARQFVASVVAQLYHQIPGFAEEVEKRCPAIRRPSASDAFRELVVEILHHISKSWSPPRPRLLVVDALDEAVGAAGETLIDVLVNQVADLPGWLRLLATTRPDPAVLERVGGLPILELRAEDHQNREDLRRFIAGRVASTPLAQRLGDTGVRVAERLDSLAMGNFLHADLALRELQEGGLSAGELAALTPGLASFYHRVLQARLAENGPFEQSYAPLLSVLAVARAPLPFRVLNEVVGQQPEVLHQRIRRLRPYLRVFGSGEQAAYALFHQSLADCLVDRDAAGSFWCPATAGHARLADFGWAEFRRGPAQMSEYSVRALPAHLAAAGRWEELLELASCAELDLFTRWIERGEVDDGVVCLEGLIAWLRRQRRSPVIEARLATQLARMYALRGQYDEAERALRQSSLAHTSWWHGRRERAVALHELGSLHLYRGKPADAIRAYQQALRLCRWGWPRFHDEASANWVALATVALDRHQLHETLRLANIGLREAGAAGDLRHAVAAQRLTGAALKHLGELDRCETALACAMLLADATHVALEKANILCLQGWLCYDRGTMRRQPPQEAVGLFAEAIDVASRLHSFFALLDAKLGMGWTELALDNLDQAQECFDEVGQNVRRGEHRVLEAGAGVGMAAVLHRRQEWQQAQHAYEAIIPWTQENELWIWAAKGLTGLGALHWHSGDQTRASQTWDAAREAALRVSAHRRSLTEITIGLCRESPNTPPH